MSDTSFGPSPSFCKAKRVAVGLAPLKADKPTRAAFELLGGFDLRPGDEDEVEGRHATGNIDGIGTAQRAVDHDRARRQHELQFAGHESHHAHGGMHAHGLHLQAIAREDTGLFGEPERQDTRRVVTLVSCALALTGSTLSQQKARKVKNRRQIFIDEPHAEWLRN
jgi:hypothetical protein